MSPFFRLQQTISSVIPYHEKWKRITDDHCCPSMSREASPSLPERSFGCSRSQNMEKARAVLPLGVGRARTPIRVATNYSTRRGMSLGLIMSVTPAPRRRCTRAPHAARSGSAAHNRGCRGSRRRAIGASRWQSSLVSQSRSDCSRSGFRLCRLPPGSHKSGYFW